MEINFIHPNVTGLCLYIYIIYIYIYIYIYELIWNHWPQFESCLKLSSDHGAICIKLDLVESEKFSA